MLNTRDELLVDPLLPLVNEEPKPALTLSELFNTERVIMGAIKDQFTKDATTVSIDHQVTKEYVDNQHHSHIAKTPAAPEFDFDDPLKNMLARTAWEQMECRLASGGYHYDKEATFNNIGFMLKLNMSIYDNLPHQKFIGMQPLTSPNQIVYHHDYTQRSCDDENASMPAVCNSIKTYAVEAKSKRLTTCIPSDTIQEMTSLHRLDIEDEILEISAHNISGEMYKEMVSTIAAAATTSTMTAAADTPPSSLDIMASIHKAAEQIDKHTATQRRANWIIMGPQMAAILLTDKNGIDTSSRLEAPHASLIGNLHGMDVYMDKEGATKPNDILVGYKGNHTFNEGIVFCPHTLAMDSGDVVHPTTFNAVKSFITRGDYFVPEDASQYFHKIEFKEAPEECQVGYKAGRHEIEAGYFYCPYIPLMKTTTVPEEDLMDIVLPFGAPERKTIAELFS